MKEQDKDLFQKIGIDIDNDKINIDINQTKDFFNTLMKTFEGAARKLQNYKKYLKMNSEVEIYEI